MLPKVRVCYALSGPLVHLTQSCVEFGQFFGGGELGEFVLVEGAYNVFDNIFTVLWFRGHDVLSDDDAVVSRYFFFLSRFLGRLFFLRLGRLLLFLRLNQPPTPSQPLLQAESEG